MKDLLGSLRPAPLLVAMHLVSSHNQCSGKHWHALHRDGEEVERIESPRDQEICLRLPPSRRQTFRLAKHMAGESGIRHRVSGSSMRVSAEERRKSIVGPTRLLLLQGSTCKSSRPATRHAFLRRSALRDGENERFRVLQAALWRTSAKSNKAFSLLCGFERQRQQKTTRRPCWSGRVLELLDKPQKETWRSG